MSEFFAAYGLWLLIALLVVIVVMFLLTGRKRDTAAPTQTPAPAPTEAPVAEKTPVAPISAPPAAVAEPVVPVAPVAEPAPIAPVPVSPAVAVVPEVPVSTPAPAATPAPAPAAASGGADNLLLLKGVGPKLAALLGTLGVTSFAQIAAWSEADIAAIDEKLGNFKGRPVRDQWIDQAKLLAAGDTAGFEARYGKL
jgi:predicted flap endonuclease-1-like 5' DNA nuclease